MIANHAWWGIAEAVAVFAALTVATWLLASVHERRRQRSERRAALAPVFMLRPPTSYDAHTREVTRTLHAVRGR